MTSLENAPLPRPGSLALGLTPALCSPCRPRSTLLVREFVTVTVTAGSIKIAKAHPGLAFSPRVQCNQLCFERGRPASPGPASRSRSGRADCRAAPRHQHRLARWRRHSGLSLSSMHGTRLRVGIDGGLSTPQSNILCVRLNGVRCTSGGFLFLSGAATVHAVLHSERAHRSRASCRSPPRVRLA